MSAVTTETYAFQAEVNQLLDLMIHSLYSNREIFLRELISNASDATDKLRFEGLKNPGMFEDNPELKIQITYDPEQKVMTITDRGIGMSREEVIQNLGTIAHSGTKAFLKNVDKDHANSLGLIGQFGVGFYSAFMVADTVIVETRKAGAAHNMGVRWESKGTGSYTLSDIVKSERGTTIILHMKADQEDFLDGNRLRFIIKKYSDHIQLPIELPKELPSYASEEEKEKFAKLAPEEKWEVVNRATALWTLSKQDVTPEQYQELYKHLTHDFEPPLVWSHNKVEGKLEYTTLLYIPKRAPFDLFQMDKPKGLKLYVKRVFIMDDAEQFLPTYLRFVRGIVDSSDLPLNVSREILQTNRVIDTMKSAISKRVLAMLEKLAEEDKEAYAGFWKAFGSVLKEGPAEDYANKDALLKLIRFATTKGAGDTQNVSLAEYVARMKPEQKKIYYITAENYNAALHSPHLERFLASDIEVLLLSDRIDEWLMNHVTEYEGKAFQSVARGSLEEEELTALGMNKPTDDSKAETLSVLERMKTVLDKKVKDIRISKRLTTSPACLVADAQDLTGHMERILRQAGQAVTRQPILEVNPEHALIARLEAEADPERFTALTWVLFEQAVLAEGGQLEDPMQFVKRVNELLLG